MDNEYNNNITGFGVQDVQDPYVVTIAFLLYTTFTTNVDDLVHDVTETIGTEV